MLSRKQSVSLGGGVVLLGVVLWFWWRAAPQPEAPVVFDPYLKSLEFSQQADGTPIGEEIVVQAGSGFYADLTFVPGEELPEELDELAIQRVKIWPLVMEIYDPRDSQRKDIVKFPFLRYGKNPHPKYPKLTQRDPNPMRSVMIANIGHWSPRAGYDGHPAYYGKWEEDEHRLWAFITPGSHPPGEYRYEIILYPAAQYLSSVRSTRGSRIVIKRGSMLVQPAASTETG